MYRRRVKKNTFLTFILQFWKLCGKFESQFDENILKSVQPHPIYDEGRSIVLRCRCLGWLLRVSFCSAAIGFEILRRSCGQAVYFGERMHLARIRCTDKLFPYIVLGGWNLSRTPHALAAGRFWLTCVNAHILAWASECVEVILGSGDNILQLFILKLKFPADLFPNFGCLDLYCVFAWNSGSFVWFWR